MPKLISFKVKIETGETGTTGPVKFSINGHTVPFEEVEGGVGAGETFAGSYEVNSFAHSLAVVGPDDGKWEIKNISVDFDCDNTSPYSIKLGGVTLDETTEVNIWRDPPRPVYMV